MFEDMILPDNNKFTVYIDIIIKCVQDIKVFSYRVHAYMYYIFIFTLTADIAVLKDIGSV